MRILVDENVKRSVRTLLEQEGYDVERVQDVLNVGVEDDEIVAYCRNHGRTFLTNDDDFFEYDRHPGVFFLDDQLAEPRDVVTALTRITRRVDEETVDGDVWHVPDGWV